MPLSGFGKTNFEISICAQRKNLSISESAAANPKLLNPKPEALNPKILNLDLGLAGRREAGAAQEEVLSSRDYSSTCRV